MARKKNLSEITVSFEQEKAAQFNLNGRESDVHESCIIWNSFQFWTQPEKEKNDHLEDDYEEDQGQLTKIGQLSGCLILVDEIADQGEDPALVCDDISGDLGEVIFKLDQIAAQSADTALWFDTVYYIESFSFEADFNKNSILKKNILNSLPEIIFNFLHNKPDVLAFIPRSKPKPKTVITDERVLKLKQITDQKIEAIFSDGVNDQNNLLNFGKSYQLTEEDINLMYPDEEYDAASVIERIIEKDEYKLLIKCDYQLIPQGEFLYKTVEPF